MKIAAKDLKCNFQDEDSGHRIPPVPAVHLSPGLIYQQQILDHLKTIESYQINNDGFVFIVQKQTNKATSSR